MFALTKLYWPGQSSFLIGFGKDSSTFILVIVIHWPMQPERMLILKLEKLRENFYY